WVRRSTRTVTSPMEINPPGLRRQALAFGQGYGFLWWTRERPDTTDAFHGSYAAEGAGGQYIWVIPKLDMVIAHKVVSRDSGPPTLAKSVTLPQFETLVRAIAAARCEKVAPGALPSQAALPSRVGTAPCHFAAAPFTAYWPGAAPVVPPPAPAGLVGEYELAPGRILRVTLKGEELLVDLPGGTAPLDHISAATFGVGSGAATLTFTLGKDGQATALVMRQNGSERTLPKLR
ncbi:MAG: beta-lactamase, partial [Gemmatimonadetes bacterium]|nr:beta-lactamase [Gemmatimonadota bacterium]